jgi:3',5'-cyclic AMP phosphodiesterase CpdA
MPITLPPISRRRFLAASAGAGLGLLLRSNQLFGAERAIDPHRLALLSDVHIAASTSAKERGVMMYDHLRQVCGELLDLTTQPAAIFINGDCAYHTGETADYQTLLKLLHPLRQAGHTLHLGMGNHDDREHLWKTIPDSESHVDPLPQKQVSLLEYPRANVLQLDSLNQTNHTPGVLGEEQLNWLKSTLDAHAQKPAIVMVHHQPDERPKPSGLTDTQALLDVLLPRRQVKALFYGHTHVWEIANRSGMHCINLPAVAYVFKEGEPSGWVDAHLRENGMSLELRCVDASHPKHGQKIELTWRA